MSLSIGIIGLPNVGKSTLFNALLKRQAAVVANYPFATIEPNMGIVGVPDRRLQILAKAVKKDFNQDPQKITPATVKFYDIAGLVRGASKGQGLGNKFLSHIREVDAVIHVVREFTDENVVREGSTNPQEDISVINTELRLADIESLQKQISKKELQLKKDKSKENAKRLELMNKVYDLLNSENEMKLNLTTAEIKTAKTFNLLSLKPVIYVYNIDESELGSGEQTIENKNEIKLCAKIESELSALSDEDQKAYMVDLGIAQSGLDLVIVQGYEVLGLETFLTARPKEVRAWQMEKGTKAPQAAGTIHSDFGRGFIKASVVSFDIVEKLGSVKMAQEKGLLRLEGKEYVMADGDVVEFRFNVS